MTGRHPSEPFRSMTAEDSFDASRQAEYPDPLEYVLRGRAATLKPRKREDYAQAIGMYERRPKVPMRRVGADCSVIARKRGNARGAKGAGHRRWE